MPKRAPRETKPPQKGIAILGWAGGLALVSLVLLSIFDRQTAADTPDRDLEDSKPATPDPTPTPAAPLVAVNELVERDVAEIATTLPQETRLRIRAVDDENRPLAGISIEASRRLDPQEIVTAESLPEAHHPALEATVSAPKRSPTPTSFESARTDVEGYGELRVRPGVYQVSINTNRNDPRTRPYRSESLKDLRVEGEILEHSVALLRYPCAVEVIVRDRDGQPAIGVLVRGANDAVGETDRLGVARLDCLPEGRSLVQLDSHAFGEGKPYSIAQTRAEIDLRRGEDGRVEFTPVKNGVIEVVIPPCGDAEYAVSLECFDTDPTDAFGARLTARGRTGSIVRLTGVPPSRYRVAAEFALEAPCYSPGIDELVLHPGASAQLALPIVAANRSFVGRVIDHTGTPRRDVLVTVFDLGGATNGNSAVRKAATTNDAGEFRFDGLPNVPLRGGCDPTRSPGDMVAYYGTFERPYFEVPATDEPVELLLEAGCSIRGTIEWGGSKRPDLRAVAIDRRQSKFESSTHLLETPGPDGRMRFEFEFKHLRRGAYRLCAGEDLTRSAGPVKEVVVSPDSPATRSVEIELAYDAPRS